MFKILILPLPEKFLDFHPPKFLMTFFSHRPQISNFPPFSLFQYISLCFEKIIISLCFEKCPPCFRKNSLAFYILYVHFVSPYFDHDALNFMHHPMHVLDASAYDAFTEAQGPY